MLAKSRLFKDGHGSPKMMPSLKNAQRSLTKVWSSGESLLVIIVVLDRNIGICLLCDRRTQNVVEKKSI